MRHTFCPDCGQRLTARALGDEGLVPWCDGCQRPWFDSFSTCIIAAVRKLVRDTPDWCASSSSFGADI